MHARHPKKPYYIPARESFGWNFYGHEYAPAPRGKYKFHICIQPNQLARVQDKLHDLLHNALDRNLISLYKIYKLPSAFESSKEHYRQLHSPFVVYLNDDYDYSYLEKITQLCQQIENLLSGVTPGDISCRATVDLPLTPHLIFRQSFLDADINKNRYIGAFEEKYASQIFAEAIDSHPYQILKHSNFNLRKQQLATLCEEKTENTLMQAAARQLLAIAETEDFAELSDLDLFYFYSAVNLIEATFLKPVYSGGYEYNELIKFSITGKFQEPILKLLANSIPRNLFEAAKEKLMTCITENEQKENSFVVQSAKNLVTAMDGEKEHASSGKLHLFSRTLRQAEKCIKNPSPKNTRQFFGLTHALIQKYPNKISSLQSNTPPKQKKRSCSGLVIAAALGFCGALIIAASIYLAAVTFFSATPISIAGIKVGLGLISAGAAAAAPAAGSVAVSGLFGIRMLRKGARVAYAATHKENAAEPITVTSHPIVKAAGDFSLLLKY